MIDLIEIKQPAQCASCGKGIGAPAKVYTDGVRVWETSCKAPPPPPGTKSDPQQKLPDPGPGFAAAGVDAPPSSGLYVQIAAWIPINRVQILLRAIEEARR